MIHHWDFFGPDSTKTAEHFKKHLHEFARSNECELNSEGFFSADENHTCFWVEIRDTAQTLSIKQKLRPRRSLTVSEHEDIVSQLGPS